MTSEQPTSLRILVSDDGNGYNATECRTCGTVIGPAPQQAHELNDCVAALNMRLARLERRRMTR